LVGLILWYGAPEESIALNTRKDLNNIKVIFCLIYAELNIFEIFIQINFQMFLKISTSFLKYFISIC
jgi:hypothetical protein